MLRWLFGGCATCGALLAAAGVILLIIVIAVVIIVAQIYVAAIYTWLFGHETTIPTTIHGMPTTGVITATFHDPDYLAMFGVQHTGVDIANAEGTPIYCTSDDAKVEGKGYDAAGYGHYLKIRDRDSDFYIILAHLRQPSSYDIGDDLDYGDLIGYMGSSGNSTGNHLHYEIRDPGNNPVNPEGSEGCCH